MRTNLLRSRRAWATATAVRPTAVVVAIGLVATTLTLAGAIGFGLRLPGGWLGTGPESTSSLDYDALGRRLPRLRDGYVRDALGSHAATAAPATGTRAAEAVSDAPPRPVAHAFTNDDFEHAYAVGALPFSAQSDTAGASRQAGEPGECLPAGGTSWYRFVASGPVALFANTFGTKGATALAVYTGDDLGSLKQIGCDVNALGNAQVGFPAQPGTYWFQLTRAASLGSSLFELRPIGATTVETVTSDGEPATEPAYDRPAISGDGRWVAFSSFDLHLGDTPAQCDRAAPECTALYLRDRVTGVTTLIMKQEQASGAGAGTSMLSPALSFDGRYLAFDGIGGSDGFPIEGYRGTPDAEDFAKNIYLLDRVTGKVELLSRNSDGEPARRDPVASRKNGPFGGSAFTSMSGDGRYVAFNSDAANLGAPAEFGESNVYIRDRLTGVTRVVSTDANGEPNGADNCAAGGRNLSDDGRFVTYMSNVAAGGGPASVYLVYLWDGTTGRSRLVSAVPEGVEPQGAYCPSISAGGSTVGFVSHDPLVPEDTNGTPDVYVYDVATGAVRRISVTSDGSQVHDPNFTGREHGLLKRAVNLSADGRYAVFDSAAPDLAPSAVGSTRQAPNTTRVYVHDLVTGATTLASVSSTGEPLAGDSHTPYIAPDGRSVAFMNLGVTGQLEVFVHDLR